MSGVELLSAMSYVDARFVDEAENQTISKSAVYWRRWLPAAACLCIVIAGAFSLKYLFRTGPMESAVAEGMQNEQLSQQEAAGEPEGAVAESGTEEPFTLMIRVEAVEGNGFTGTVAEGDCFEPGVQLNVVLEESAEPDKSIIADSTARLHDLAPGTLVRVRVMSCEEATGTIYVSAIEILEQKG